jgi:Ca2+-binding EF-hand superfamily protein
MENQFLDGGDRTSLSKEDAIAMIREKVKTKLKGGPGELNRAFRKFDFNSSGTITWNEFVSVLGDFGIKHLITKEVEFEFDCKLICEGCQERFQVVG